MRNVLIFVLGLLAGSALTQWVAEKKDDRTEEILEQFVARMDSCRQTAEEVVEQGPEKPASSSKKDDQRARKDGDGRTYSATKGEVVTRKPLKVQEVLDNGDALAEEYDVELEVAVGIKVLLPKQDGKEYYDDQIIKMPAGKCARQIGVYRIGYSTYPIVEIGN